MPALRHNALVPEHPCSGEVIEREEFSMGEVRVVICSSCGTEFSIRAGFRLAKSDSPRNAKSRARPVNEGYRDLLPAIV